jgi:hypothetical protein
MVRWQMKLMVPHIIGKLLPETEVAVEYEAKPCVTEYIWAFAFYGRRWEKLSV